MPLRLPLILFMSFMSQIVFAACPSATRARLATNGGQVFDAKTQLTWMRCSLGMHWAGRECEGQRSQMNLKDALKAAAKASSGWRVPTVAELVSLIDDRCGSPPVDVEAFPDLRVARGDQSVLADGRPYWTTSDFGLAKMVYYVDFYTGVVDAHSRGFSLAVRLVRSKS